MAVQEPEADTEPLPSHDVLAPPRGGMGLAGRLYLAVVLALAAAIGLTLLIARREAIAVAEARIARDLDRAPTRVSAFIESECAGRRQAVRSALEEAGPPPAGEPPAGGSEAYRSWSTTLTRRLDAERVSPSGRGPARPADDCVAAFDQARNRLALVVSTPLPEADGGGELEAAFAFDGSRLAPLAEVTGSEVALVAGMITDSGDAAMRVVARSAGLDPTRARDLATLLGPPGPPSSGSHPIALASADAGAQARAVALRSSPSSRSAVIVVRSLREELAPYRRLRGRLLAAASGLVLLAWPLSWLAARPATRALARLAAAAEEVGHGRFDPDLPRAGGEVGVLVRAFATMMGDLAAKADLDAVVSPPAAAAGAPAREPSGGLPGLASIFAGRYELLSVLGEGGMGTVYRARDQELDDEVALKMLKPNGGGDGATPGSGEAAGELLRQEIKLARMVTHPNVVRVHDFGESDGVRYFTMEYVPGTTLREVLTRRPRLDLAPTLQVAKQICRGLAAVHRAGIVHGDLKPQNVIVCGNGVVKLMDFGVARTRSMMARGEPLAGTPAYMSPEQARGADLDERSDLYSAGVLLFELFTGRCPFVGGDAYETMHMHLEEAAPNPRSLRPDLPQGLSRIIVTCLEKSKLRRPASATELERMLMRVRV